MKFCGNVMLDKTFQFPQKQLFNNQKSLLFFSKFGLASKSEANFLKFLINKQITSLHVFNI